MKVYLINLDRAEDRLSTMSHAFAAAGVEFTRISAVDGKELSNGEISSVVAGEDYWGWLTRGEIGCFLSHRLCWKAIAEGQDDYGVVFEDDVLLGDNAAPFLSGTTWIPRDAGVIKLETAKARIYVDTAAKAEAHGYSVKRLRSSHYAGSTYVLSKQAARYLLEKSVTFSDGVDHFLFGNETIMASPIRLYQLVPAVCIQRYYMESGRVEDFPSFIEGRAQKTMKKLSFGEKARLVALRESQSAINKLLTLLGKRERIVVEFK